MKVLIVDDEVIITRALERAFKASGHSVASAHSGIDGLELWLQDEPDLVLLDVLMPGLTGPQVIEEYDKKIKLRKGSVILMSAHSDVNQKDRALAVGADDFIQKPFENVFDIVKMMEKHAQRSS